MAKGKTERPMKCSVEMKFILFELVINMND